MKTSELSEFDLYLFHQGTNYHAYEMLGAHFVERDGKKGVRFAVWAPHAKSISVVGDFNEWDTRVNPMTRGRDGEIWEVFIPDIEEGAVYKYAIEPQWGCLLYTSDAADDLRCVDLGGCRIVKKNT